MNQALILSQALQHYLSITLTCGNSFLFHYLYKLLKNPTSSVEMAAKQQLTEANVASIHGNGVFSDFELPVAIRHTPVGAALAPLTPKYLLGRAHYILPTLPAQPAHLHPLTTTELYIAVSPIPGEGQKTSGNKTEITLVEIYAGRDRIWKSKEPLNEDRDFSVNVTGLLHGNVEPYNENPKGLGVTVTVKFVEGEDLLISSVALIQKK